jgi:uncharacterized protein
MIATPLYAGILALLFLALCLRVSSLRGSKRTSLGDGGDPVLMRAIRGHANFAEFVPLILLMMALLELSKFSLYLLHAMGITLVLARLLHGYALSFTEKFKFGRFWGAALSYLLLAVGGVLCLYQGLRALPLS